jgi:hypothetical protein
MMWHDDGADTWDDVAVRQQVTERTVESTWRQTWANHVLTRGMIWLVCKGATWPTQGLPRGTPSLVHWLWVICKSVWYAAGGRTRDLRAGNVL